MTSSDLKVVVSICTFNRYDVLPKAIESIVEQTLPDDKYEIVVVDNSADERRAAAYAARFRSIGHLTYTIERIPGLSNARNASARLCKAPFIAFIDDDAIAHPTWLEEILRAFDKFGSSAMVVGGQVEPLWGAPRPKWLHDSMLGNLSVVDWGGEDRVAAAEEWFAGTNIAFRNSAILEHGGFAPGLGRIDSGASLLSNEELHLITRIRASGGKLVYAPKAVVSHLAEPKRLTRSWFRKRSAWQAVSDFMMDPERFTLDSPRQWRGTIGYFNSLPPHERTLRGLLVDTDDPDLFRWQLGAIYMLTAMSLAGFEGVSLD